MFANPKLCIWGLIFLGGLTCAIYFFDQPVQTGASLDFANEKLHEALTDSSTTYSVHNPGTRMIKDEHTATSVAEAILFGIYGKNKILTERPYQVYKLDEYWYLSGSLHGWYVDGGSFEIILDSRDAHVVNVRHYR